MIEWNREHHLAMHWSSLLLLGYFHLYSITYLKRNIRLTCSIIFNNNKYMGWKNLCLLIDYLPQPKKYRKQVVLFLSFTSFDEQSILIRSTYTWFEWVQLVFSNHYIRLNAIKSLSYMVKKKEFVFETTHTWTRLYVNHRRTKQCLWLILSLKLLMSLRLT